LLLFLSLYLFHDLIFFRVGSLKLQVSFAKEPYKRDDIIFFRTLENISHRKSRKMFSKTAIESLAKDS